LPADVVALGEAMVEFYPETIGPLRNVKVFTRSYGGDTSNVVVAVSRLGGRAGYVTKIGDDDFGACLLGMWRRENVDTSHVVIEKGGFTGIYFLSVTEDGEWEATYFRKDSAASHFTPDDIDPDYIRRAKIFHFSGISQAISGSCREAAFKAAQIARDEGVLVSYDPNVRLKLWPLETAKEVIQRTLKITDIALPSLRDARLIFGDRPAKEIAEKILRAGVKIVAIKMGAEGCLVATKEKTFTFPAYKVEVIDTAGSGDAFDAGIIVGLLEGWEIEKAAIFANAAAALKCLGRGAVEPLPCREAVEAFLKQHNVTLTSR